jgi:hypothetical protein
MVTMTPHTSGDVDALQVGFMSDGVLRALRIAEGAYRLEERHAGRLREGAALLRIVAEGVGAAPQTSSQVAGLSSFTYAAEALRAVGTGGIPGDGVRAHFAALAATLDRIAAAEDVSPGERETVRKFFRALSDATLESCGVAKVPGPVGAESAPWALF